MLSSAFESPEMSSVRLMISCLKVVVAINACGAGVYGEAEFIFAFVHAQFGFR
jgi:amino acid permease